MPNNKKDKKKNSAGYLYSRFRYATRVKKQRSHFYRTTPLGAMGTATKTLQSFEQSVTIMYRIETFEDTAKSKYLFYSSLLAPNFMTPFSRV